MANPLASTLKFLKSPWLWGSLAGILYISYVCWISQLDDKELRAEHREWAIGLLFPAVIGGGGYWLNQQSENRAKAEQEKAEAEAEKERDLREKLAKQERQEQREQADLKYYFDRISTLVVENGLTMANEESETYQIARALTANILRELSTERMNQVMFFLRSLKLTGAFRKIGSNQTTQSPTAILSVLRGIELNQSDLQGLNASVVDFQEANLEGANLEGANLYETNLGRAKLRKAKLRGATLYGAILIYADLIEADLREADLQLAKLTGAIFIEAQLGKAKLYGANLNSADLSKANLREADLNVAELIRTDLIKADLRGASLYSADLSKANLIKADFRGANLSGGNLNEADFRGANLSGVNFSGADFTKAKLSAHLSEVQQQQCKIYDPIIVEPKK